MLTGAQETIALAPQLALYPGLLDLRHGDRLQFPGRRAAGRARPARGPAAELSRARQAAMDLALPNGIASCAAIESRGLALIESGLGMGVHAPAPRGHLCQKFGDPA